MRITTIVLLLCVNQWSFAAAQQGTSGSGAAFTAVALSAGGPRSRPVATQLDIVVERWSTDAERQRLLQALPKGQDEVLKVLQDLPRAGFIRTPGQLGWELRFAQQVKGEDGGRRVYLATDRPIAAWEAINRPRTFDYPFTFIELRMNTEGEGEGKLTGAMRIITGKDGRIELENWDVNPVELTQVRERR